LQEIGKHIYQQNQNTTNDDVKANDDVKKDNGPIDA
jgi:hypothetical protein